MELSTPGRADGGAPVSGSGERRAGRDVLAAEAPAASFRALPLAKAPEKVQLSFSSPPLSPTVTLCKLGSMGAYPAAQRLCKHARAPIELRAKRNRNGSAVIWSDACRLNGYASRR